ncbi:MAG: hypothetical protein PHQ43_02765 [Dehalococcoidales bacterium]|nr:hypothetical protein [Dehalococcoidales bacterium]
MKETIDFDADKVKVNGPLVDRGFSVTFYTGEYAQEQVAELVKAPQESVLHVRVTVER